jgi:hypothetical protein
MAAVKWLLSRVLMWLGVAASIWAALGLTLFPSTPLFRIDFHTVQIALTMPSLDSPIAQIQLLAAQVAQLQQQYVAETPGWFRLAVAVTFLVGVYKLLKRTGFWDWYMHLGENRRDSNPK